MHAFLTGAGPAAIAGSCIPLGLALAHLWQLAVLAGALVWMVAARRNVVIGLLAAALMGMVAGLAGLPTSA